MGQALQPGSVEDIEWLTYEQLNKQNPPSDKPVGWNLLESVCNGWNLVNSSVFQTRYVYFNTYDTYVGTLQHNYFLKEAASSNRMFPLS